MEASENKEQTLAEIVASLKGIADQQGSRREVEYLKAQFYRTLGTMSAKARQEWVSQGNAEEDFVFECAEETELKQVLEAYRQRRGEELARLEAARQLAFEKKSAVVEKLGAIVAQLSEAGGDVQFEQVRELQKEWNEAGEVAPSKYGPLVIQYGRYMEQFYDYLKINHEMRDYDFRKNLEAKSAICEKAEELAASDKVNDAFIALQVLHAEWREIGPVIREERERIWNRFKEASDKVNKRHAQFYEARKAAELESIKIKTALCEAVESMDLSQVRSAKAWEVVSNRIAELREEWRKSGYASKKENTRLYERFNEACGKVNGAKVAFFKEIKSVYSANIDAKKALCEKAEALKESEDGQKAIKQFMQLQKEWKNIGAVPHKISDELWSRFKAAGDAVFEAKKAAERKFKSGDGLRREREKLVKLFETMGKDIRNRENNLGFLNTGSNNPLVAEMQRNIDKLKDDQTRLLERIKELEDQLNNAK